MHLAGRPGLAFLALLLDEVQAGLGVLDAVMPVDGAVAFLDLAVEVLEGQVLQRGLEGWAARVGEDDGCVDNKRVGQLHRLQV